MKFLGLSMIALGLLAAAVPATAQETGETSFTIYAVDEGGQFFFEGADGTKNPTLVVPAGAEITVKLINRGNNVHNMHVDGSTASEYVQADGDEITYTFTAPASGSKDYWCDPHKSAGMKGVVRVAGAAVENGDKNESPGVQTLGVVLAMVGAALVVSRRRA